MKKFFFCIFLFLFPLTIISKKLILTMDKVVKMAYKYNPNLKAHDFAIQASKENEKVAISGYLPQINFVNQQFFKTNSKGLHSNTSLQISQLIFSFAGPLEKRKIARKETRVTKLSKEEFKDLIHHEVEISFLENWLLQQKYKLNEELNKSSKTTIEKAEHKKNVNLLDKNNWLTDEAMYAHNMANFYIYEDELNNAKNKLEYFIGKKFNIDLKQIYFSWNPPKKIILKKLDFYYKQALQNRKEIKEKQKMIERQYEYENYYKRTYLPNLTLSGNSGRGGGTINNSVGATLNWNFFDGAANFHELNKANANKLKILMEKEDITNKIKYEVQDAFYVLLEKLKLLSAQNVKLYQAKNEYILKKQKLQIGEISSVDFETAKYNLEVEKFIWLALKVDTIIKKHDLTYACGYPRNLD